MHNLLINLAGVQSHPVVGHDLAFQGTCKCPCKDAMNQVGHVSKGMQAMSRLLVGHAQSCLRYGQVVGWAVGWVGAALVGY